MAMNLEVVGRKLVGFSEEEWYFLFLGNLQELHIAVLILKEDYFNIVDKCEEKGRTARGIIGVGNGRLDVIQTKISYEAVSGDWLIQEKDTKIGKNGDKYFIGMAPLTSLR